MRSSLPIMLCAAVALTGCSRVAESPFNPLNWLSGGPAVAAVDADGNLKPLVPEAAQIAAIDNRPLIDSVTDVALNPTPDGVIVTATGLADTQGQYNAQLVPIRFDGGALTLGFRVVRPDGFAAAGPVATRTITVARVLKNADLVGVRQIIVQGARNSLGRSR